MNLIPDVLFEGTEQTTWVVVGASRGIGLEFVRQLLARGERIYATVRDAKAWHASHGRCQMFICDVLSEASINNFVAELASIPNLKIDYCVINAGVMLYPNRATEVTFDEFAFHLHTNTIGPIITAQRLLATRVPIGTMVFMSSDSASASRFPAREDGFAAYAASKAALNTMVRHMAAELNRADDNTIVLALHPGVVAADAEDDLGAFGSGPVDGILAPAQSVAAMINVIQSKGLQHSGSFWTWEDKPYPW